MTERTVAVALWGLGIVTVLTVSFALAAAAASADPLGMTLPRDGWAAALIGWGLAGGSVILAVGRAVHDAWPARTGRGVALLVCAVAAAVAVELTVMRWALARFGAQSADPELIGWSSILSPLVLAVGLAALASAVLPAPGRSAARVIALGAAAGVLLIVASNLPGGADGITPLGVPMAFAMAAAALVTILSAALVLWPARSGNRGDC